MNLLRWIISAIVGCLVAAAAFGAFVLVTVAWHILAIIAGVIIGGVVLAVGIMEYWTESREAKKRRKKLS